MAKKTRKALDKFEKVRGKYCEDTLCDDCDIKPVCQALAKLTDKLES